MSAAFDCIVVGGGPGGSTAATLIALAGFRVMLLEREPNPTYKIGESLLPSTILGICPLLGAADKVRNAGFIPKRGGTFLWGKSLEPWTFDFGASSKMASASPMAFQVERVIFDRILLDNAREKGVHVRQGCKVLRTMKQGDRVVGLEFLNERGEKEQREASFVLDASGHQSVLARSVGERVYSKYFQNVAVFGYFENGGRMAAPNAGNIFCAAFEDGWFWYIPLRPNLTSVGVVLHKSRADELRRGLVESLHYFIDRCAPIKHLLANARRVEDGIYGEVRSRQDYSYSNTHFWSPGIALVGDAACFVDPVFSSGVHLATYSALLAARSVNSCLRGDLDERTCFGEFEKRYRREYANMYEFLLAFYNLEQDLPSYFWQAQQITKSDETDELAFLNLVGGVASSDEALLDSSTLFERRKHLKEILFSDDVPADSPDSERKREFYRQLLDEIGQVTRQGRLGEQRRQERPLFNDGLIPSRDGFHWSLPASETTVAATAGRSSAN